MSVKIVTKKYMDSRISNIPMRQALFDLVIVPKELAKVVEVELDDGFVLAKTENVISVEHRFSQSYLLKKIEEHRSDIMCAVDSTFIDEVALGTIIHVVNNPIVPKNISYEDTCTSCLP